MQAIVGPLVSAVIGAIGAAVGVYVAVTNRLTRTETLIDELRKNVEKHNNLIERMVKVESETNAQWRRIDEHKDRLDRLEERL